jgi:hypothetical protein
MPIPTRSHSVKAPSTQSKQSKGPKSESHEIDSTSELASSAANYAANASRLPGPGRSLPALQHARSQSSTLAIPRLVGARQDVPLATRLNPSTVSAHTRSRSLATTATQAKSQDQRPNPTHSLLRAPPHVSRPTSKTGLPSRSQQQVEASKRATHEPQSTSTTSDFHATTQVNTGGRRLRDELVQLSVTHAKSHKTLDNFALSVRQRIEASSSEIRSEEEVVRDLEQERQSHLNAGALHDWFEVGGSIQNLSFCVSELSDLNSDTGLYSTYVQQFEDWLDHATEAQQQRTDSIHMLLVEPMDRLWVFNLAEIDERLAGCEHILRNLDGSESNDRSALTYTLRQLHALTISMRRTLEESQRIYESVLSCEKHWIEAAVAKIIADGDEHENTVLRSGLWN